MNNIEKLETTGLFTNYIYKAIPLAFDESMSYYETLCGLLDYLKNTVIPTVNNNADAIIELQNLYTELHDYVEHYFDNLDVQQEINNKLDEMASNGTLTQLIKNYVDPIYESYESEINHQIDIINNKVDSVASGSPLIATSTSDMTDTTRVYVNTTDGKWYYYDGDSWEIGGTYQSTAVADNSVDGNQLKNSLYGSKITMTGNAYSKTAIFRKGSLASSGNFNDIFGISKMGDITSFKWKALIKSSAQYPINLDWEEYFQVGIGSQRNDGTTLYSIVVNSDEKEHNLIPNKFYYYEGTWDGTFASEDVQNANIQKIWFSPNQRWSREIDFTILNLEIIINNKIFPLPSNYFVTESTATYANSFNYLDRNNPVGIEMIYDILENEKVTIPKTSFTLPFVNNLYMVKGAEQSVPIFIDYLYDGRTNKILFNDDNDRHYPEENQVHTQNVGLFNKKETLSFKSDTLQIPDVTYNNITINENVPNGTIKLLIIGDSVTAGAITNKTYWEVARELFAIEDIKQNRTSDIMFLGSSVHKTISGEYNNQSYSVQACACGVSGTSLNWWLTDSNSPFVSNGQFSINTWLSRYRNYDDNGNKLNIGDPNLGSLITASNINNVMCCTPNIIFINHTHNGGTITQYETAIETIRTELPNCKIIIGAGMPLIGTWFKDRYVNVSWLPNDNITGPNYNWGSNYGTSRVESMQNWCTVEAGGESAGGSTYSNIYYAPQIVTCPTVDALEAKKIDFSVKQMNQVDKLNQLPKEHPGTTAHKIWGYELYCLLKFIQGVNNENVTNNFNSVPLYS